jgi:flagellar M-ring protein FliF
MGGIWRKVLETVKGKWEGMDRGRRGLILASFIGLVLGTFLLLAMLGRPRYSVLFSNLSSQDAGEIVELLKSEKIPYKLGDGGGSILVPSGRVHEIRLKVASKGLPRGSGVGFEIFDKGGLGMSDFVQRTNYQRALQGELERTIGSLSEVEQARVHISIPQEGVFLEKAREPSASVLLKLKPGASMDGEKAKAIAHLVASAVEGLTPERVTIVDTNGRFLSDLESTSPVKLLPSQMELVSAYEKKVEEKIAGMLEKALGPGKSVVKVSAILDMDHVESNREIYEPSTPSGTGMILSEKELSETFQGQGGVGGVPGARALIPTYQASSSGPSSYQRREVTRNYEITKRVERQIKVPGDVKRLSVAVIVNGNPPSSQLASLRSAIATAAGIDERRGDRIIVTAMPFDTSFIERERAAMEKARREEFYISIAKYVVMGIVGLLLLLFLRKALRRKPEVVREEIPEAQVETVVEEVPEPVLVEEEKEDLEKRRFDLMRRKIEEEARERAEVIANFLRAWIEGE